MHDGEHLDRFRARAEHNDDFLRSHERAHPSPMVTNAVTARM
jgi:hypothetical protein